MYFALKSILFLDLAYNGTPTHHGKVFWVGGKEVGDEFKWECSGQTVTECGLPIKLDKSDDYSSGDITVSQYCLAWFNSYSNGCTEDNCNVKMNTEYCSDKKYPICKCNNCPCSQGKENSFL